MSKHNGQPGTRKKSFLKFLSPSFATIPATSVCGAFECKSKRTPQQTLHTPPEFVNSYSCRGIVWCEKNGPKIECEPDSSGFGTLLAKSTVRGQLRGELTRDWKSEGLAIRLVFAARSVHPQ